jgi:hypothetical protein
VVVRFKKRLGYATKDLKISLDYKAYRNLANFSSKMPKAKRFSAQNIRPGAKSTHIERARIREIEQSRTGFEVERSRIKTKYRTRLTRIKQNLERQVNSETISANEREERIGAMADQLNKEKEEELQAMAYEWYQLAYATEMEGDSEFSKQQELKKEVGGADDDDYNDDDSDNNDDDDYDDDYNDEEENHTEKTGKNDSGLLEGTIISIKVTLTIRIRFK